MFRAFFGGLLIALTAATSTAAQTPVKADSTEELEPGEGAAVGFSVGKVIVPGEDFSLTLIGFHVLQLRRGSVGSEFAVYTSPYALSEGAFAFAPQWSMASTKAYGGSWIVSKIGVNAVMAFGADASGMVPGAHLGLGALLPASPRTAFRFSIEPHWFLGMLDVGRPIVFVSMGITFLPQARK